MEKQGGAKGLSEKKKGEKNFIIRNDRGWGGGKDAGKGDL